MPGYVPEDLKTLARNEIRAASQKDLRNLEDKFKNSSGSDSGNWTELRKFSVLGSDLSTIEYTGLNAKELTVLYYGRLNNSDDSESNAIAGALLNCNKETIDIIGVSLDYIMNVTSFGYIRGPGTYFSTLIRLYVSGGIICGDLLVIPDNSAGTPISSVPVRRFKLAETITDFTLTPVTNGILFKSDSKLGIWYR